MSRPSLDRRAFLGALDRSPALRAYLEARHSDALHLVASFRKRVGDNCSYVLTGLKKIWYDEWEFHPDEFAQHLGAAGLVVGADQARAP